LQNSIHKKIHLKPALNKKEQQQSLFFINLNWGSILILFNNNLLIIK